MDILTVCSWLGADTDLALPIMKTITVYTALYDLDRASVDSRLFSSYVEWLKSTIELFPGIVVFHDGALDVYDLKNCTLIKKPLQELEIFHFLEEVETVLKTFKPVVPNDITFRLSSYALLQYAKFEFATHLDHSSESVMWVDAGISRFITELDTVALEKSARKLLKCSVDALFEIDIKNNLEITRFALSDSPIGSCRRVISGGGFWLRQNYVELIYTEITKEIRNWLRTGIWDNEQVMLRKILPKMPGKILYVPQLRGVPGCVPRSTSNVKPKLYKAFSPLITSMLRRGLVKRSSGPDVTTLAE